MTEVVDGEVVDEIGPATHIRVNAEDPETGEYVFLRVTPKTAEELILALQDSLL